MKPSQINFKPQQNEETSQIHELYPISTQQKHVAFRNWTAHINILKLTHRTCSNKRRREKKQQTCNLQVSILAVEKRGNSAEMRRNFSGRSFRKSSANLRRIRVHSSKGFSTGFSRRFCSADTGCIVRFLVEGFMPIKLCKFNQFCVIWGARQ